MSLPHSVAHLVIRRQSPVLTADPFLRYRQLINEVGPNKHDQAIVLITALIGDGVTARPEIEAVAGQVGLNRTHVRLILREGTGVTRSGIVGNAMNRAATPSFRSVGSFALFPFADHTAGRAGGGDREAGFSDLRKAGTRASGLPEPRRPNPPAVRLRPVRFQHTAPTVAVHRHCAHGEAHCSDRMTNMAWDLTRDAEVYSTAAIEGTAPEERLFAGCLDEAVTYIRGTRPSDQALLAIRLAPDDEGEGPIDGARIPELFPMR